MDAINCDWKKSLKRSIKFKHILKWILIKFHNVSATVWFSASISHFSSAHSFQLFNNLHNIKCWIINIWHNGRTHLKNNLNNYELLIKFGNGGQNQCVLRKLKSEIWISAVQCCGLSFGNIFDVVCH